jgi:tetraacyldisaccharide 4'-kinase
VRRAPAFWTQDGLVPSLLAPVSHIWEWAGNRRRRNTQPQSCPVPVICIGNLVVGGAGKTPVAIAIARLAAAMGQQPHLLSRGYGGSEKGPLRVEPARHLAAEVGDEALLLAGAAPAWIARDRAAGARRAAAGGASLVILDDGLQNPTPKQDLAILVIDGEYGFGNGRVMPAGPLRERLETALPRLGAAILLGADRHGIAQRLQGNIPLLRAALVADTAEWQDCRVVAFAGIGRPEKFFASLETAGAQLVAREAFPDHHPYRPAEIARLRALAAAQNATLVTTEKDWVRLALRQREGIAVFKVALQWETAADLEKMRSLLSGATAAGAAQP